MDVQKSQIAGETQHLRRFSVAEREKFCAGGDSAEQSQQSPGSLISRKWLLLAILGLLYLTFHSQRADGGTEDPLGLFGEIPFPHGIRM